MPHHDIAQFLDICGLHGGGQPSKMLLTLTKHFDEAASTDLALLQQTAAALPSLPPDGAAWLAITLGCIVEKGVGAEVSGPPVVDLFLSWLPSLPGSGRTDEHPLYDDATWTRAFTQLCIAVVSFLAQMPQRREELSQIDALRQRLEEIDEFANGAAWVLQALRRSSGKLVLIHAEGGGAFRVRYDNVATCFHLFSLIQIAFGRRLPGGQTADPKIAAAAYGRNNDEVRDTAWWHYGDPRSPTANLHASVWGESSVRDIPSIDGTQVIVLWPPVLASRAWDSGFFKPHLSRLPPTLTIEAKLGNRETQAWFDLLKIPRARPWWRWW